MQDLYTSVTFSFLRQLERASLHNDREAILELGVTPKQADAVSSLRTSDVFDLSRVLGIIDIEIDEELLQEALNQLDSNIGPSHQIPNTELTGELLRSLSRIASDHQNFNTLRKFIRISDSNLARIGELKLSEINDVIRTGIMFYEITANEIQLNSALDYIFEKSSHRDANSNLIKAGASWPMIHELTGMSKNAYSKMRAQLKIPNSSGGAPRTMTEQQSFDLYEIWTDSMELPLIQRILKIHNNLGVELRVLWPAINEYRDHESKEALY